MSSAVDTAAMRALDGEARHAAQADFDRPLIVEAGAGTGKTSTLIARLLHWCLGPGWERTSESLRQASEAEAPAPEAVARATLEGVQAITFTDNAAAEMTGRAGEALAALAGGNEPPAGFDVKVLEPSEETVRQRAVALLAGLDHLTIQTFHSWCSRLLTTWPLEAGIHPDFTVDADQRLTEILSEEVLETRLIELYGADEGLTAAVHLLASGIGPVELREVLHRLVQAGVPSGDLEEPAFTAERLRPPFTALAEAAGEVLKLTAPLVEADGATAVVRDTHALVASIQAWADALIGRSLSEAELDSRVAILRDDPSAKRIDVLRRWSRHGYASKWEEENVPLLQPHLAAASARLETLLSGVTRLDPVTHERLREVLAPLLDTVANEKRRRGIVTFDDLLDLALRLLRDRPAVASSLRQRCDQLMVDEFQDTDPRQCELVRCLALDGPVEQRPGLFIVGDPKQSLYGWRQADLAAYDRFLRDVEAAGGVRHTLSVNFRSLPVILDEVSRTVAPVMREAPALQPRFHDLLPSKENLEAEPDDDSRPAIEYWTLWRPGDQKGELDPMKADAAAEREAVELARDLVALHASGAAWRDAGVLLRSRGRLQTVLDALRAAGIPFQVKGERSYYQRREIVEAQALLRAVVQPRDRLALVTLLRTAWVGVPDAALLPLLSGGLDELLAGVAAGDAPELEAVAALARRVAAAPPADVPGLAALAGWEENLIHAARSLGTLRAGFLTQTPDRFVDDLRRLLLVDATEAARNDGAFRCANLDRFFRQLEGELEGEGDLAGLLRFLQRSVDTAREAPAAPPSEATADAVQIMTIHSAKGLAFTHVYLPQVSSSGRGSRHEFYARRPVDLDSHWALTLLGTDSPERILGAVDEQLREGAERVRLLYVAMTRARRRLVISGIWPLEPRPQPDPQSARSFCDLLTSREGLPTDFSALWRRAEGGEGVAEGGAWWRLLLPESAAPATSAREPATWIPTDDELRQGFAELEYRRAAARDRQQRSPITRASARAEPEAIDEASRPPVTDDASAALARLIGTEIHRLFETWNPSAEAEEEYRRLTDEVTGNLPAAAHERALELLRSFHRGPLYPRWLEILPRLLARELPILVPRPGCDETEEPHGAIVGSIDFIYRDPETGDPVLGDFKTDRLDPAAINQHAALYRNQADAYRRAVARALGHDALPRFELWFLDPGGISPIPD